MKASQLHVGMVVAVKRNRYSVVKAVILDVGGWTQHRYGAYPFRQNSNESGHAVAYVTDDGRCLPDVVQSAQIIDTWENHEAAEAQKREHDVKAREAQNRRHAAITQEIKTIQPVLASFGIAAFVRSDTGEFTFSLAEMKKLGFVLSEGTAHRECADARGETLRRVAVPVSFGAVGERNDRALVACWERIVAERDRAQKRVDDAMQIARQREAERDALK